MLYIKSVNKKQNEAVAVWLEGRGLIRLPDSSYGPHVGYIMVPVPGRKSRVRVLYKLV